MNEINIIKQCQAGRMEAFGQLYDAYADKIFRFVYYKTMHRETAEDLTSQTFTKAVESLRSFDPAKGSFSSWLYRIARNNVIDHYRTSRHVEDIDALYDLGDDQDIPVDLDVKNKLAEIRTYLKTIKQEHREIVMMRLWDQLSYQEIADITGKTIANCKMIYSRTLGRLREDMAYALAALILLIVNHIKL